MPARCPGLAACGAVRREGSTMTRREYTVIGPVVDRNGEVDWIPTRVYRGHVAAKRVPPGDQHWGAQVYARNRSHAANRAYGVIWLDYVNGRTGLVELATVPARRSWWSLVSRRETSTASEPLEIF